MKSKAKDLTDEELHQIVEKAKKPILRNVSVEEISSFRKQVEVIDMIGCSDDKIIIDKIKELGARAPVKLEKIKSVSTETSCGCVSCEDNKTALPVEITEIETPVVVQAQEPLNIVMDKAGYFVILPIPQKKNY